LVGGQTVIEFEPGKNYNHDVVAMAGDGTTATIINKTKNHLVLPVPCGSGNDIPFALGLGENLSKFKDRIESLEAVQIDRWLIGTIPFIGFAVFGGLVDMLSKINRLDRREENRGTIARSLGIPTHKFKFKLFVDEKDIDISKINTLVLSATGFHGLKCVTPKELGDGMIAVQGYTRSQIVTSHFGRPPEFSVLTDNVRIEITEKMRISVDGEVKVLGIGSFQLRHGGTRSVVANLKERGKLQACHRTIWGNFRDHLVTLIKLYRNSGEPDVESLAKVMKHFD